MGKSYNRNQDKYNKWDRERQQRDGKRNKFKKNSGKKTLTSVEYSSTVGSDSEENVY